LAPKYRAKTIHLPGEMILLGTGTSVGVPTIGCGCPVCTSADLRNCRTRCAAVLGLPGGNLLIDTPPDLRFQMLREGLGVVHAVLYTHEHADHMFGLDDLRIIPFFLGHPLPLYCEALVEERIRTAFDYAFTDREPTHEGAVPQLTFHRIDTRPFQVLGADVVPIRLQHGPRFQVLGFRFGNVAYCTDVSEIPAESWPLLEGLDTLVLDALRLRPHPTHLCLDEAVAVAQRLKPRQTLFTHVGHDLDFETTNARLPPGMALAYDGQRVQLT
jgi:phosphoribosyl 1,2-cyclic phosphate phosphodiesterase